MTMRALVRDGTERAFQDDAVIRPSRDRHSLARAESGILASVVPYRISTGSWCKEIALASENPVCSATTADLAAAI
jgi:hypothetical protein